MQATSALDLSTAQDPSMQEVLRVAKRVASSNAPVIIFGETGAGKDLLAQYIHNLSRRASGPFQALNCSAIPRELFESEMFGHNRGAFSGAWKDHVGMAARANKGTLFLDEVSTLVPEHQAKLLGFLQTHKIRRVGSPMPEYVDVRVIAATNENLRAAVRARSFREDLYYRLAVVKITVPPLRNRPADILPLAEYFVSKYAGDQSIEIPEEVKEILCGHTWPGNVRELENVMRCMIALSEDGKLLVSDMPDLNDHALEDPAERTNEGSPEPASLGEAIHRARKKFILAAYERNRRNPRRTISELKLSPKTLYNYLHQYEKEDGELYIRNYRTD